MSEKPTARLITIKEGKTVVEEGTDRPGRMRVEHTTLEKGRLVKLDEKGEEKLAVEVDPLGLRPDRSKDRS